MAGLNAAPPALSAAMRKARLIGAYLKGAPVHCTWQLSPRCESFCQFCEHRGEAVAEELDAGACAAIAEALGQDGSLLVSFTGSEPFLRGDLPEIVAAVARHHFPLLVTNGWLVTPEAARAVWQAGLEVATVALEDADAGRHDALAGLPGAHARAVAALDALSSERTRRGQRVNVRARVRDHETAGLAALLELAVARRATVTIEAAFPLPQLEGEADDFARRLSELKARHPHLRTGGPVIDRMVRAFRGGVGGCLAGRAFFNVDHRGRVTRCLELRGPSDTAGTLTDGRLPELRTRLREIAAGNDCRACFYASRAEIETLYTVRGFLSGLGTLVRA